MTRLTAAPVLLAVAFLANPARADGDPTSLRAHFGVDAAEALGASDSLPERLRGLERLGAIGTPRALLRLVRALEPGGSAKAPEERLTAVRELARHTEDPSARRALARVLGGHSSPSASDTPSPLDELAEQTAALALSRSGTPDSLASLGKALESPGRAAVSAVAALVAHPPRDIAPVLDAARIPSLSLTRALDELADQRSFDTLRDLVRIGPPEVRAAAAVALTRLGDFETVELSRHWLALDEPSVLRVAAVHILAMAHAEDAPKGILSLLADPSQVGAGVALALEAPSPSLVPELVRLLERSTGDRADELVAAIGRAGGDAAAKVLAGLLDDAALRSVAAYQLARMPGSAAARVLTEHLLRPSTQRLAARALTARKLLLDEEAGNLRKVLTALLASKDEADRGAAAAGLSVLSPDRIEGFVSSGDDAVVRGAASCLLLAPPEVAASVAERLLGKTKGDTQTALALALAVPGAAEHAPTATLLALVDGGGAAAPLAARALGARDESSERARLDELFTSTDPLVRAHVALGLGESKSSDAGGRLESAYRLEVNPEVRAAIVRALALRAEPSRTRVLTLAAALDPDADVRAAATFGASTVSSMSLSNEGALAWVPIVKSGSDEPAGATVAVEVPGGLVLPATAPPDGLVVLSGLPPGHVVLRVAPATGRDNSSARGPVWQPGK